MCVGEYMSVSEGMSVGGCMSELVCVGMSV